eukprot:880111-Amphidinium_carterae.1
MAHKAPDCWWPRPTRTMNQHTPVIELPTCGQQYERSTQPVPISSKYIYNPLPMINAWLTRTIRNRILGSTSNTVNGESLQIYGIRHIKCAVSEYINIYWKNDPTKILQQTNQFDRTDYYLLVVQTTTQTLEVLTDVARYKMRKADWYVRRKYDEMYQINGIGNKHGRAKEQHLPIPEYFMSKFSFRLQKNRPIRRRWTSTLRTS